MYTEIVLANSCRESSTDKKIQEVIPEVGSPVSNGLCLVSSGIALRLHQELIMSVDIGDPSEEKEVT